MPLTTKVILLYVYIIGISHAQCTFHVYRCVCYLYIFLLLSHSQRHTNFKYLETSSSRSSRSISHIPRQQQQQGKKILLTRVSFDISFLDRLFAYGKYTKLQHSYTSTTLTLCLYNITFNVNRTKSYGSLNISCAFKLYGLWIVVQSVMCKILGISAWLRLAFFGLRIDGVFLRFVHLFKHIILYI